MRQKTGQELHLRIGVEGSGPSNFFTKPTKLRVMSQNNPSYLFRALFSFLGENRFTFLSYVTLATLGYGDIVPLSGPARGLAILEAMIGQIHGIDSGPAGEPVRAVRVPIKCFRFS